METLRGYVTLHFQRTLSSHPVPNRGLRISCFLSSLVEPARPWLDFHMSRIIYCHRQDKVQKASFLKQQRFACVEQYRRSHVHHVWWWNVQLCQCARFKPALLSQNAFWEALETDRDHRQSGRSFSLKDKFVNSSRTWRRLCDYSCAPSVDVVTRLPPVSERMFPLQCDKSRRRLKAFKRITPHVQHSHCSKCTEED